MTKEDVKALSLPYKFTYDEIEYTIHEIDLWDDRTGDEVGMMVISDSVNPQEGEYTVWFSEESMGYICLPVYEDIDDDDDLVVLYVHEIF